MTSPFLHTVHLYKDDVFLVDRVAAFARRALEQGEAALLISGPAHRSGLLSRLERETGPVESLRKAGRLTVLDAAALLDSILVHQWPDRRLFFSAVGSLVAERLKGFGRLTVYGEMVDLLWRRNFRPAAVRLEELWNELGAKYRFTLSCACRQDVLAADAAGDLTGVCRNHSAVYCDQDPDGLERAFDRSIEDVVGRTQSALLRHMFRREGPGPETTAQPAARPPAARGAADAGSAAHILLWLREKMPDVASRVTDRMKTHFGECVPVSKS